MDGSQKLPQRLLSTVRDRLQLGLPIARQALAIAAWMRFVTRTDDYDKPIPVDDPQAAKFAAIAGAGQEPEQIVPALLAIRTIFGEDLAHDPRFAASTMEAFVRLTVDGSLRTAGAFAHR
jgi:fructuronate reductase